MSIPAAPVGFLWVLGITCLARNTRLIPIESLSRHRPAPDPRAALPPRDRRVKMTNGKPAPSGKPAQCRPGRRRAALIRLNATLTVAIDGRLADARLRLGLADTTKVRPG